MKDAMKMLAERGVVLLGCGKMGGAMLNGWLAGGLPADAVQIVDPHPAPQLLALADEGVKINPATLFAEPAVALLAVKPQVMAQAIGSAAHLAGPRTVFVSVVAGTPLSFFEARLGAATPIVRTMPNIPAAVGRGVTALYANAAATPEQRALAEALLGAVGATVWLEAESQIDAVTGVSGSGPAYVFHMIEALAAAGEAQGLSADLAVTLARATVCGAGELAYRSDENAAQLRINVTSPGGTTAAALAVLMAGDGGLSELIDRTVDAAVRRSRELRG